MSKIIFNFIFSNLILTSNTFANDTICTYMSGKTEPTSLERFVTSCEAQKKFALDPDVKAAHRSHINNKLAEILASKIEQNSEELAILTNYFNTGKNGNDLLMGNQAVMNECKLSKVSEAESCISGKRSQNFQEKMAFLKKHLPTTKSQPNAPKSLESIIASKFTSDLKGEEDSSCPLNKKSGLFLLMSQIDEGSASEIIARMTENTKRDKNSFINQYAHLKFINDANDPALMQKLISHLSKKPNDISSSDHIANFFNNSKNHDQMSTALYNRCKQMNDNLKTYLCSDVQELGTLNPNVSEKMFSMLKIDEPLDKQYEVDLADPSVLTAYGMQCLLKEKSSNKTAKSNESKNTTNPVNLDDYFNNFTSNTRKHESNQNEAGQNVDLFCKYYECKDALVANVNSCKKGGPISSSDLKKVFKCSSNGEASNDCRPEVLKSIKFLESLEIIKSNSNNSSNLGDASNNSSQGKGSLGRLPAFAEHYLGIEGSLRALGRPINPETVAEKTKQHEEKIRTMEDSRLAAKDEIAPPTPFVKQKVQTASDTRTDEGTYSVEQAQNEFRSNRTVNNNFNSAIRTPPKAEETKRSPIVVKNENSENLKEAQRMREEMEKLIAGMKGAGQDSSDLESQLEEMKSVVGKKLALGTTPGPNRAEEERLRRWDQTLKDRSRDLDQYRRELDERRYSERGSAREDSGRAPATKVSAAQESDKTDRESGSASSSGGSSNGIKLAGSSNGLIKADQKAETAAIIQSGKESSTMTTDELIKLSPENLEKFGIDASKPFTLRVNFNNATYDIPVRNFPYKGNSVLGPVVDKKNKQLNDFLLKSPLFKKYYDYQIDKVIN